MKLAYRPEIDGLRAIAVVSVIIYHAELFGLSGGFVGVDIFFVISGYLITSILLSDISAKQFSLRGFYERRARRILPALYVVMAVCVPFAWIWMLRGQITQFGASLVAVCLFVSNILFWQEESYFAPLSGEKPLLHTWSLGVEEQFYLIFPLLLAALWRLGRKPTVVVLALGAVASLGFCEWGWRHAPTANFYLIPSRAWELLAGSFCAISLVDRERRDNGVLAFAGLAAILASLVLFSDETPFPSLLAMVPVAGAVLIILFAGAKTWVGRLLGSRPFVSIGLISYSAYLWHQPLLAFARLSSPALPPHWEMAGLAMASFALAWVSWRYVERPFRDRKAISARLLTKGATGVGALFVILGLFLQSGASERLWTLGRPPAMLKVMALFDAARAQADYGRDAAGRQDDGHCRFNVENLTPALEQRIIGCRAHNGAGLLVLGDSHAIDLFGEVISRSQQPFIVGLTQGYCRPHTPKPQCQYDNALRFLAQNRRVFGRVIFEQAGFYLLHGTNGRAGRDLIVDPGIDGTVTGVVPDPTNISGDVAYLRQISALVPVVWLGPRLDPMIPLNDFLRRGCAYSYHLRPGQGAAYERLDAELAHAVSGNPRLEYVSQIKAMHLMLPQDLIDCRRSLWSDTDHYSAAGEVAFGKRLPPIWGLTAPRH